MRCSWSSFFLKMNEDNKQADNPFAAFFAPRNSSAQPATQNTQISLPNNEVCDQALPSKQHIEPLDRIARDVFFITCKQSTAKPLVFLEDLATVWSQDKHFNVTLLGEALFERLLINDPKKHVTPSGAQIPSYIIEEKVVLYLFECWRRLQAFRKLDFSLGLIRDVESLILRNFSTALIQPELYPNLDPSLAQQTLQLLTDEEPEEMLFFTSALIKFLVAEDGEQSVELTLWSLLEQLKLSIKETSLLTFNHGLLRATLILAKSGAPSASLLLRFSQPKDLKRGRNWADTLLGQLLSLSCLPQSTHEPDSIFTDVVAQPSVLSARESSIHMAMNALASGMHSVFEAILRSSPENRKAALDWLWGCLESNKARGSLWSTYGGGLDRELSGMMMVPDGFALNLEAVALRLCAPFCRTTDGLDDPSNNVHPKLLTVDPSFCAVESGPYKRGGLDQQTCLLPSTTRDASEEATQEIKRPHSETFTFVTESFFLAHRATDLGSRVARERLSSLNQDTARIERLLHQIGASGSEAADSVRDAMKRTAAHFLAYRTALTEPTFVEFSARFQSSTATWLVQLLMDSTPNSENRTSFAPGQYREVKFPLPGEEDGSTGPAFTMQLVPELVVENLSSFLVMARKFHANLLEQPGLLWPALTLVVALMGSPGRVKNPHLRARLAEVLEAMLPWQRGEEEWLMERQGHVAPASRFQRERLFKQHPHRLQISESLVRVFVDIEMTGQSVAFEQKFSYRHPMYVVLEHLWSLPEHQNCFKQLAQLAEKNMESVTPPVFLRFANLLINDAVFLLDEALAQMMQLRQKQTERESDEWQNQPAREREQNERQLEHMGGLARSYNILGRETIHMLEMITSEIQSLFCHPTMVDRIAAMLNYFLLQLVGPKSKSLKVHNMKEFEFDPGRIVLDICRIYTHLGSSNESSMSPPCWRLISARAFASTAAASACLERTICKALRCEPASAPHRSRAKWHAGHVSSSSVFRFLLQPCCMTGVSHTDESPTDPSVCPVGAALSSERRLPRVLIVLPHANTVILLVSQ
ncbi:hypothetical protein B566_EDAN002222 [Ephemera danica]|nr:hypothetical protein B566_EDAN002222 [Ephemera danica]